MLAADDQDAAFLPLRALQAYLAANSELERSSQPRFWFVTSGAQSVLPDQPERVSVEQAALWGAARVVGEEHPDLWGGLVDLDPTALPTSAAEWLTQSVLAHDGEDQIALRRAAATSLRLVPADPDLAAADSAGGRTSAYLITGGLGGVGLHIARAMADSRGASPILAGSHGAAAARTMGAGLGYGPRSPHCGGAGARSRWASPSTRLPSTQVTRTRCVRS